MLRSGWANKFVSAVLNNDVSGELICCAQVTPIVWVPVLLALQLQRVASDL